MWRKFFTNKKFKGIIKIRELEEKQRERLNIISSKIKNRYQ